MSTLPDAVRRGSRLGSLIDVVIRLLHQRGHRVTRIGLPSAHLDDLAQFAAGQPGQKLTAHGWLHDEIGYVPAGSDGPLLDDHVAFTLPLNVMAGDGGDLLDAAGRSEVRRDHATVFVHKDEHPNEAMRRFDRRQEGYPVPAIVVKPAPKAEEITGEGSEVEDVAADGSEIEDAKPGASADGTSGTGVVETSAALPGVPVTDGAGAPTVSGGAGDAADVSGAGVDGKTAKAAESKTVKGKVVG